MYDSLGVNKSRTEIGVLMRDLNRRGYQVVPIGGTPQFHVQPAPSDGHVTRAASTLPAGRGKEGPGRV